MNKITAYISKKRALASAIISLLFVFYAFNFVPRNINLLETRSLLRQLLAFGLNFVLFFIASYLILTLIASLIPHSKSAE
ncbi:MAG TPA: hypothetical protein DDZ05_01055 [Candidatus Blackburnbacteria bacterium]|nr:hypothetical protein [Candidatus Blackburnbacteria bacterium]